MSYTYEGHLSHQRSRLTGPYREQRVARGGKVIRQDSGATFSIRIVGYNQLIREKEDHSPWRSVAGVLSERLTKLLCTLSTCLLRLSFCESLESSYKWINLAIGTVFSSHFKLTPVPAGTVCITEICSESGAVETDKHLEPSLVVIPVDRGFSI